MRTLHFYLPFLDVEQHVLEQFSIRRGSILSFIKCCESELDYTRFLDEQEIKFERKMQLFDHLTQLYDELYDLDSLLRIFKFKSFYKINIYNRDHDLINTFDFNVDERDKAVLRFLYLNASDEHQFHHYTYDPITSVSTIEFFHI